MRSTRVIARDDDSTPKVVNFVLRVDPKLREDFVTLCAKNDMSAAQVMRRMMREYVAEQEATANGSAAK